jgi:glycosyltransferase involved in cell wall biosynthesis
MALKHPDVKLHPVAPAIDLSVVIPLFNEEESVDLAIEELLGVLDGLPLTMEVILVNDGSTDATGEKTRVWHQRDDRVKVVEFRRNYGQTAAISAGFEQAAGRVVVVMDGDQQNDPADIPRLLDVLGDGCDVVSGWRADRKDKLIMRRIPSRAANRLISRVTGLKLHDYGCTLKAYDREVIEDLELFGELHRFIPALTLVAGAKVVEIPVNHRAREHGSSKYGISRLPRVLLDLLTVKFLVGYRQKPMQFFGRAAMLCAGAAGVSALISIQSAVRGRKIHQPGLFVPLTVAALQFVSFGLLGELLTRIYFKDASHRPYVVEAVLESRGGPLMAVPGIDDREPEGGSEGGRRAAPVTGT